MTPIEKIKNYARLARHDETRVVCGRLSCGYPLGGVNHNVDMRRPNVDCEPAQHKLSREEKSELVHQERRRQYGLLTDAQRREYNASHISRDYVRHPVRYEWDFCFNSGWIQEADGVWRVTRRSRKRVQEGRQARFRRAVPHHSRPEVSLALRRPHKLPVAAECPKCGLLQLVEPAPLRLRTINEATQLPYDPNVQTELRDSVQVLGDHYRTLSQLSDWAAREAPGLSSLPGFREDDATAIRELIETMCRHLGIDSEQALC